MERQLLIVLTVILMAAGCQQLPVNSPNTNEINYDIPTDDPDPNLYTSYDIWQYLVLNNPQSSDYSLNERTLFYMNMHLKDDDSFSLKKFIVDDDYKENMNLSNEARELMYLINQSLEAITKGIEKFQMNVAIARIFEIVNAMSKFEINDENKSEVIPNTFFSNPLKNIYFKFIKKQNPYSKEAVEDLLKKYKNNVTLIKGNSNLVLKKIDMSKIDFVFLDGGHAYQTVKNDLECCLDVVNSNGTFPAHTVIPKHLISFGEDNANKIAIASS